MASLLLFILAICILTFRLGTLNKGASLSEINYIQSLSTGKNLLIDPAFLVHKLPSYLVFKLGFHSIAMFRLVSVLFATITVASGFVFLKRAYTTRVATMGAGLLLISAWMLHVGRSATPEASFLLLLPLLLVASWLHTTTRHYHSLIILSLVVLISFYIPGFWILTATIFILERKSIWAAVTSVPWWFRVICAVILLTGLMPLVWAMAQNPNIALAITGLPQRIPDIRSLIKNLQHIPQNLFIFGPPDPSRWLGRLPILDLFSSAMLVLGVYSMRYHIRQRDTAILFGSSVIVVLLVTVGGLTNITALIPLLYIFIGAGMAFMLQQWMVVFPKNPFARTLATTLMSVTILLVAYLHVNHYFIAWPQTPATKHAFGHSLLK